MSRFSLFFVMILIFASCQQQHSHIFKVNGTIKNSNKNKIALINFGADNAPIVLDTATVDSKGIFNLKSLSNNEELYAIKIDSLQEIWFVNDSKEIIINVNANDYKSYQTIGSAASETLHAFISKFDSLLLVQKKIETGLDTLQKQKVGDSLISIKKAEIKTFDASIKKFCYNSIEQAKSPALKYFYLYYAGKTNIISEAEIFKLTSTACSLFPTSIQLNGLKERLSQTVKSNPKLFLINEPAADFNLKDTGNNFISLQTFKGKYLLLDFWESSNKEYRSNVKNKIEIYKEFKDKNFEILSISLDSSRAQWKKILRQDSIYWTQVNDSVGLKTNLFKKYYFSSTPYNVLIGSTGKIIAMDIPNEKLKEKLQELIN